MIQPETAHSGLSQRTVPSRSSIIAGPSLQRIVSPRPKPPHHRRPIESQAGSTVDPAHLGTRLRFHTALVPVPATSNPPKTTTSNASTSTTPPSPLIVPRIGAQSISILHLHRVFADRLDCAPKLRHCGGFRSEPGKFPLGVGSRVSRCLGPDQTSMMVSLLRRKAR